ncbi:hypothetical protein [Nocardia nova]|uniref:hypothetical protein n=1 Tax=Nocardia nova TaxID=37330 RepID=UPI000CE9B375|nr:hypothetical protein [Nocardia nova]PPJ34406.1 hypothetical protein C5E41_02330 [Nocardia nova]
MIIIDNTGERFDPDTPPGPADHINVTALNRRARKEAAAIQGTAPILEAQAQAEHTERVAAAEAEKAARVSAGGGVDIATELRGEIGAAVAGVLALDGIDAAARKVRARIDGEITEITEQQAAKAQREHRAGLLAEAWDAASAKQRVPELMAPHLHWSAHVRPQGSAEMLAITMREELNVEHAVRRQARVLERLADLDALITEQAVAILDTAGSAADTLAEAGLSVSATAEDILNAEDLGVAEAWRVWQGSVARWSEIQSARRWVAVALAHGFSPRHPGQLIADADTTGTEANTWGSQWVEVAMPTYVVGASAALVWWLRNRPAPAGITESEVAA